MNVWRQFIFIFIYFCVDVVVFREYISVKDCVPNPGRGGISHEYRYDLVVGILSARRNFNLRESLRKTWVGHAKSLKERILVKFIISDQACFIPPEYQIDPYHCEEHILHDLVHDKEIIAYTIPLLHIQSNYSSSSPVGRDFSVLHPIVITHLGIFENGLDEIKGNTTVLLYDKITKKEIASVNFSMDNRGILINGSWFKIIPNFVLPKDFQASVVSENFNYVDPGCSKSEGFVEIQDGGGLIVTHQVKRFDDIPGIFPEIEETVHDKRCPYASGTFIYQAHVVPRDPSHSPSNHDKELRFKEWKQLKLEENMRLHNESQLFSDILFVPNTDVYRNLPSQLLEFYRWISKNITFSFTLKTDDDCFVDVESILKAIHDHKFVTKSQLWWSRFRTNWLVDRVGKWAEPDYPGATYPSFACGAGYVLSADLVHWLARNADSLKRYQGEDVSMGIWLSAVGPNIVKDQRWSCFQECFSGVFTSPEHDSESLHEMWENFQTCGNPCSCS